MLAPKKYKYRKTQRGNVKGFSKGGNEVCFGDFGLTAREIGFIDSRQIEAARVCVSRELKKEGKYWIRIFPHKPITKRPAETRMGKGKGDVDHYCAVVKPGRVMFEVGGIDKQKACKALKKAAYKLPIRADVIARSLTT